MEKENIASATLKAERQLKEAKRYEKQIIGDEDLNNINEFEGMKAQGGKVTGRVSKILDPQNFDKFRDNDILVTTMTSPDFIHLMKRSKAIVTDERGIICHAAIVARELNKPCIMGTKIATEVLETGYMVEINANHGLVKRIEKA
jgi:pyruvate, water dikinase